MQHLGLSNMEFVSLNRGCVQPNGAKFFSSQKKWRSEHDFDFVTKSNHVSRTFDGIHVRLEELFLCLTELECNDVLRAEFCKQVTLTTGIAILNNCQSKIGTLLYQKQVSQDEP